MASRDRLILFFAMDGVSLAAMIGLDKFNDKLWGGWSEA